MIKPWIWLLHYVTKRMLPWLLCNKMQHKKTTNGEGWGLQMGSKKRKRRKENTLSVCHPGSPTPKTTLSQERTLQKKHSKEKTVWLMRLRVLKLGQNFWPLSISHQAAIILLTVLCSVIALALCPIPMWLPSKLHWIILSRWPNAIDLCNIQSPFSV